MVLFSIVIMFGMSQSLLRNFSNTRVTRSWVAELENLLGGEDFFAFTFLPSFYLELQVQNPYYNSVLYVGSHPSEHFQRNVVILSEQRPRYVLLDYASVAKYGHTLDNPVDEFLRGHYQQVWAIPHGTRAIEVWERF